jgi:hypothetical protein
MRAQNTSRGSVSGHFRPDVTRALKNPGDLVPLDPEAVSTLP